jgi:hypothetical protein
MLKSIIYFCFFATILAASCFPISQKADEKWRRKVESFQNLPVPPPPVMFSITYCYSLAHVVQIMFIAPDSTDPAGPPALLEVPCQISAKVPYRHALPRPEFVNFRRGPVINAACFHTHSCYVTVCRQCSNYNPTL